MEQQEGVERLVLVKEKEYKFLREIAAKVARDKKHRDKKSGGNKEAKKTPEPSDTNTPVETEAETSTVKSTKSLATSLAENVPTELRKQAVNILHALDLSPETLRWSREDGTIFLFNRQQPFDLVWLIRFLLFDQSCESDTGDLLKRALRELKFPPDLILNKTLLSEYGTDTSI